MGNLDKIQKLYEEINIAFKKLGEEELLELNAFIKLQMLMDIGTKKEIKKHLKQVNKDHPGLLTRKGAWKWDNKVMHLERVKNLNVRTFVELGAVVDRLVETKGINHGVEVGNLDERTLKTLEKYQIEI